MDPSQLIPPAVTAIADRIAHVGAATATPLTDSVVDRLYGLVAARLSRSPIGARFLRELETRPQDPSARRDVAQAVTAEAEADEAFAAEIGALVDQLAVHPPQQEAFGPGAAPAGGQPGNPSRGLRLSTGAIIAVIAGAVVLLLVSTTLLVNVVLPQIGLTEGARLDRIEGRWAGQDDDGEEFFLTIKSDGSVTIETGLWPCPGRVTSPARSDYVFDFDCGIVRLSYDAELNFVGDQLTLRDPDGDGGDEDESVLNRE